MITRRDFLASTILATAAVAVPLSAECGPIGEFGSAGHRGDMGPSGPDDSRYTIIGLMFRDGRLVMEELGIRALNRGPRRYHPGYGLSSRFNDWNRYTNPCSDNPARIGFAYRPPEAIGFPNAPMKDVRETGAKCSVLDFEKGVEMLMAGEPSNPERPECGRMYTPIEKGMKGEAGKTSREFAEDLYISLMQLTWDGAWTPFYRVPVSLWKSGRIEPVEMKVIPLYK